MLGMSKEEPIDFDIYQDEVSRTKKQHDSKELELCDYTLGLNGEAGEVADIVKKGIFHKHGMNTDALQLELGDVLWYVAAIASANNISLKSLARRNINKLRQRYPEGFNAEHSINIKGD